MAVLQSLNDFQHKTLSTDSVGNTIYSDLLRMVKILKMILHDKGNEQQKNVLKKELEQTVGQTYISVKAFINALNEHDFVDQTQYQRSKIYSIDENKLNEFESFLKENFENDRCTVLGHYSLALIRKILTYLEDDKNKSEDEGHLYLLPKEAIKLGSHEEEMNSAFTQLKNIKLLQVKPHGVYIEPEKLIKLFQFHTIIKSFDHTVVYSD